MRLPEPTLEGAPLEPETEDPADKRPPLGSWPRLYALVLGNLVVLILLFTLFTAYFDGS